jgi:TPR repeat protein
LPTRNAVQVDAGQDFDVHITRLLRAMDQILQQKTEGAPVGEAPRDDVAEASAEIAPGPGRGAGSFAVFVRSDTTGEVLPLPLSADGAAADAMAPSAVDAVGTAVADGGVDLLSAEIADRDRGSAITVVPASSVPPPLRRRGYGAIIGLIAGVLLGVVATFGIGLDLKQAPQTSAGSGDVEVLTTAKQAAEAQVAALQAELAAAHKQADQDHEQLAAALAAAQQKAATAQDTFDAAKKQLDDQSARLRNLQARADTAASDLATEKDINKKGQAQIDQFTAQAKAFGDQQARTDTAEKELAVQKEVGAKALAQIDQLNAEIESLRGQLAAVPAAPLPAAAAPTVAEGEANGTIDERREIQWALRVLGHYQGKADGTFGANTQAAIKRFQSFAGDPETGSLTEAERRNLLDMAQRLSALFDQPAISPQGVAAASIKDGTQRYARGSNFETGKGVKADPAEAAYWYALAAGDGEAKAFTNLGHLLARGWGATKPDPAAGSLLWWAAAARGETTAMFNLGAMYERGIGVSVDVAKARAWYERAAARNDAAARAALKRLGA